jgi:hypothetical protein
MMIQVVQEEVFLAFKAAPIDPRIFESQGDYGVPRVEKKPLTVPVEFNLHSTNAPMTV